MCGIVASSGPGAEFRVARGLDAIAHRGVRRTTVEYRGAHLGHVRLPIVGVGDDHDQPVHYDDGVMAFVGELLDFRETHGEEECDLEVVRSIWEKEGPPGFADRDGFWSIVAINDRTKNVELFCDYLAQKPLYYCDDPVLVASELVVFPTVLPFVQPNPLYFSDVMKWGYCPSPAMTPYKGVFRVRPGEFLSLPPSGGAYINRFAALNPRALSFDDLRIEIERAVRRRVLASDVPVAALVSGGLDSAIVYTLASRHGDVKAYHVLNNSEETARFKDVVKNDDKIYASPREHTLVEALGAMQEPLDLGSLLPQLALSAAVQERVCLTGDGADEFFGGYGRAGRYDSQASDVNRELVCYHLPRLDRVMMRNKVEVRSPFLARRVCEAALALPWSARKGKGLLRAMFDDIVPESVLKAPKVPLRTKKVEDDREANSIELVNLFYEMHGWKQ